MQWFARNFALLATDTKSLEIFTSLGHLLGKQVYTKPAQTKGVGGI